MPVEVKRTLVKSRPELWAEVSDPGALARHLGPFDSVRITRVQPESVVDWEGERSSGSVHLEPSGFGTRVTLRGRLREELPAEPAPPAAMLPEQGFWSRLLRRAPETATAAPLDPEVPVTPEIDRLERVLAETMDALGVAHHRPFSRV